MFSFQTEGQNSHLQHRKKDLDIIKGRSNAFSRLGGQISIEVSGLYTDLGFLLFIPCTIICWD